MSPFQSGSAFAMTRDVANGYQTVTTRTFRPLTPGELNQLTFEIDRHTRELRAEMPDPSDMNAVRTRNQKILRLVRVTRMIQQWKMERRS